jgi:hypothetical protein
MAEIVPQRMTAEIDGDFVVFIIGLRINRLWKLHKWVPVFLAMPRMLRELEANADSGFLGAVQSLPMIVQYWRSFEQLERYARSHEHAHWPAWVDFNKRVRVASGDVGIWHETYLVRAGEFETFYGAMPRIGLAAAARHVVAGGAKISARGRLGGARAESDDGITA